MVAPQGPTGRAIRQAIFDHQAHGQRDGPVGVVTAGRGQIGQVGREIFPTPRTEVLGVGQVNLVRASRHQVAEVMQAARELSNPIRRFATLRTRPMLMSAVLFEDLGPGEIFEAVEGDIGQVFAGPKLGGGRFLGSRFGWFHGNQVYPKSAVFSLEIAVAVLQSRNYAGITASGWRITPGSLWPTDGCSPSTPSASSRAARAIFKMCA